MTKLKKYRFFHYLVMAYLIAAFAWWAILLTQRNTEIYELKKQHLVSNNILTLEEIELEYELSKKMVLGEGLVFAFSILIGLLLINRAFWAELKLNKRLNNFLLSVTHELKTPITSLKLINQTLATKTLQETQKSELLESAQEESMRLESLVNNILTAAQIESAYKFNFEKVDINIILSQRITRFDKILNNVHIQSDLSQDALLINADKEALIKLVDNLIDNAIKYSKGAEFIIVKSVLLNESIDIEFIDFGEGINDKEKKKILGKFYRIGNEEIRETKGTGLGLFIVKEIADAHKAKMSILDNPEGGAIFKLVFPKLKV